MKKKHIASFFIVIVGIFVFFSYVPCVLGASKMEEKYIVIINGIEMHNDAATVLLRQVAEEKKKSSIGVIDKNTGRNIDISVERLKPGMSILVSNSKKMVNILELFGMLEMHATELRNEAFYEKNMRRGKEDVIIKSTKYSDDKFCASDDTSGIFLCVNSKIQIIKMDAFRSSNTIPSDIENATPVYE